MGKDLVIIEHTQPDQKEYFIEERKYANGEIKFHAMYSFVGDTMHSKYEIGNYLGDKQSAIDAIKRHIEQTPIEIITYQVHP